MTRSDELRAATSRFCQVHDKWVDDANSQYPTTFYWDELTRLVDTFSNGDLPGGFRKLSEAVFALGRESQSFDNSNDVEVPQSFWAAREAVEHELNRLDFVKEKRRLETVQSLDKAGVGHEQIARMYGLRNPDGSGRSGLILQELAQPGSVIGPDWVHPDDLAEQAALEKAQRDFLEHKHQQSIVATTTAVAEDKPCPETPRELWTQGVSLEQSSKMLKKPLDEVRAMFSQWDAEKSGVKPETVVVNIPKSVPVENEIPAGDAEIGFSKTGIVLKDSPSVPDVSVDPDEAADQYDEFRDWSEQDLKERAKELGIDVRGRFNRISMIDRIIAAEGQGVELPPAEAESTASGQVS